ncbi:threonine/homoserine/homoserine lactone efflux protein [Neisseria sp. HSC-16F19]|nr:LysE family translocator [Neisseria sp. HSC-16F19]MCP2040654.1 threonine/homoserine/homoserine lactone efflux protein [Neisseria sp. HSC-16F19]
MLPPEILFGFVLASAALTLSPGPDNIFVLTQSAMHGRRTGILITLGLCSGLLVHIAAVALGVAALLRTSPWAFTVLKICGAAYLLYLAWGAFRAGNSRIGEAASVPAGAAALYFRGVFMNITNPKVAIFFLAFLPQFTDPARGSVPLQIVVLGLIFMLIALVIFSLVALAAARLGDWLKRSERAQIYINRVAGTVFVLLAARLLLSST